MSKSLEEMKEHLEGLKNIGNSIKAFSMAKMTNENKDVFMVIGDTGAGKTTLITCLMDIPLEVGEGDTLIATRPSGPKIGDKPTVSTTVFPMFHETGPQLVACDTPGFKDTKGTIARVCANLFNQTVVQEAPNKKIKALVVVISYSTFKAARGALLRDLAETLLASLKSNLSMKSLFFVITGIEDKDRKYLFEKFITPLSNDRTVSDECGSLFLLMSNNKEHIFLMSKDPNNHPVFRENLLLKIKEAPGISSHDIDFTASGNSTNNNINIVFREMLENVASEGIKLCWNIKNNFNELKRIQSELLMVESQIKRMQANMTSLKSSDDTKWKKSIDQTINDNNERIKCDQEEIIVLKNNIMDCNYKISNLERDETAYESYNDGLEQLEDRDWFTKLFNLTEGCSRNFSYNPGVPFVSVQTNDVEFESMQDHAPIPRFRINECHKSSGRFSSTYWYNEKEKVSISVRISIQKKHSNESKLEIHNLQKLALEYNRKALLLENDIKARERKNKALEQQKNTTNNRKERKDRMGILLEEAESEKLKLIDNEKECHNQLIDSKENLSKYKPAFDALSILAARYPRIVESSQMIRTCLDELSKILIIEPANKKRGSSAVQNSPEVFSKQGVSKEHAGAAQEGPEVSKEHADVAQEGSEVSDVNFEEDEGWLVESNVTSAETNNNVNKGYFVQYNCIPEHFADEENILEGKESRKASFSNPQMQK